MISSAGFFSNIPCPFLRSGLCERPHCHFSHKNTGGEQVSFESFSGRNAVYVPTPLHKLKAKRAISVSLDGQCSSKSLEYNPTPISQLKKLKDVEYRPTKKVKQYHETSGAKMLETKDTDIKPSRPR